MSRRDDFDLDRMGIAPGTTLTFTRDSSINVTVLPRDQWEGRRFFDYRGRKMALKAVVDELFAPKASSGCCEHWVVSGRNMGEIYAELYPKESGSERIFWKKVWGFRPESQPILGWTSPAGRDRFLKRSDNLNTWVLLTATGSEHADEDERYRVLGMAKLYRQEVDTYAVLQSIGCLPSEEHFNEDGSYKWPFGLIIREAVLFPDRPLVEDILGTRGNIDEAEWVRELTPEQVVAVRGIRSEPADVISVPSLEVDRKTQLEDAAAYDHQNNHHPTGPPPSDYREASHLDPNRSAFVYRFRLVNEKAHFTDTPIFKIGYSHDPMGRCATLNEGLMPSITKCRWEVDNSFLCSTAREAYALEQLMHAATAHRRVEGTREVVRMTEGELDSIWRNTFASGQWLSAAIDRQAGDDKLEVR